MCTIIARDLGHDVFVVPAIVRLFQHLVGARIILRYVPCTVHASAMYTHDYRALGHNAFVHVHVVLSALF